MTKTKWIRFENNFKFWISEFKKWGFKITFGNILITFTKWFIGAKRIKIFYS